MDKIVIRGGKPLLGRVYTGGSKNATLPLMAAAMLAHSPSVLRNVPDLRDIQSMAAVPEAVKRLADDINSSEVSETLAESTQLARTLGIGGTFLGWSRPRPERVERWAGLRW